MGVVMSTIVLIVPFFLGLALGQNLNEFPKDNPSNQKSARTDGSEKSLSILISVIYHRFYNDK